MSAALAAGLVAMAARFATAFPPHLVQFASELDAGRHGNVQFGCESDGGIGRLVAWADAVRGELLTLAEQDGVAYGAVLAAYRIPRSDPGRRELVRAALTGAAEVPADIADAAAGVAEAAAELATDGNPNLRGDAVTAVLLAWAAARAATELVVLNVRLGGLDDDLPVRARAAVARCAAAVDTIGGFPAS